MKANARDLFRQSVVGVVVGSMLFFVPYSEPAKAIACDADATLNSLQDGAETPYEWPEGSAETLGILGTASKVFELEVTATQGNQKVEFLDAKRKPIANSGGTVGEGNTETFEIPAGAVRAMILKMPPANGQSFKGKWRLKKKCAAPGLGTLLVQGTVTVGAGIAYPCVGGSFPSIEVSKCDGSISGANTAPINFFGTGVGALASADSKCLACLEAGSFFINGSGTISGACGLADGTLTGTISSAINVGTKAKSRNFSLSFDGVGGTLMISGNTHKGEVFHGSGVAVENTANGSSCSNKWAKEFTVVAALAVV